MALAAGTETALLDAALEEVLAHGIRRTSASDIARRCGLSRQTLYRYWPDVQTLLAALVSRETIRAIPEAPLAATDLASVVAQIVDAADGVRKMPLLARLRTSDPDLLGRYVLERLGTSQRAAHAALVALLRPAQGHGVVRGGDPARLAAMTLLVVQSAVLSGPLVAEWLDESMWRRELTRTLTGYLRAEP